MPIIKFTLYILIEVNNCSSTYIRPFEGKGKGITLM